MRRGIVALFVAAAALAACQSQESAAREKFGDKFSCPADRVTAKERTDLDPVSVLDHSSVSKPPAEVAADPGRLAKWTADQEKARASSRSMYSDYTLFDVSGCDHTLLMACHRFSKSGHVSCSAAR